MSSQDEENGTGMKPSELLLVALGGCTSYDVVEILEKGRERVDGWAAGIGYGIAPLPIAGLLHKARQPFNANAVAQAGALAALADEEHVSKTVANNSAGLEFFHHAFSERRLRFVPSVANFVLVEVGDGDQVFGEMLKQGVIVRAMRGYKLPAWVRISVGTSAENARCLEVLDGVLSH